MRIAHLADLHLGFTAYQRVNEDGRNTREADVMHTFGLLVEDVVGAEPDLIVVAGDVFDKPVVTPRVMEEAILGFREMSRVAPIVIAGGNHDRPRHTSHGNPINVLVSGAKKATSVTAVVVESEPVYVAGAYIVVVPDHCILDEALVPVQDTRGPQILVVHAAIQGDFDDVDYARFTDAAHISEFRPTAFGYCAAGDYHTFAKLAPNAYYSGSMDAVNAGPWDQAGEAKGWALFDTEHPERGAIHQPLPVRPVYDLDQIDCSDGDLSRINDTIRFTAMGTGIEGAIVRQRLIDVSPAVHAGIDRLAVKALKADALHYQLKEEYAESVERVTDGNPAVLENAPMAEIVSSYVMDTWEGDPGLPREKVRDTAVGLVEKEGE